MKKVFVIVLSALVAGSCSFFGLSVLKGNGVPVQTVIDVDGFSSVSLPSMVDVDFTVCPGEQSLVFSCDENLLEYYDIRVEGGVLVVGVVPGVILSPKAKTVLVVQAPVLEGVKASGSGDCEVHGPASVDGGIISVDGGFFVKTSGSGDITVSGTVNCSEFSAVTTGSGDISVFGPVNCSEFSAVTSGSGDISVDGVECGSSAVVRSSGSGDIDVDGLVASSAEIRTSGSGELEVDGLTASSITAHTSGSGDIDLVCRDAGVIDASTTGSGSIYVSGTARGINSRRSGSGNVYSGKLQLSGN